MPFAPPYRQKYAYPDLVYGLASREDSQSSIGRDRFFDDRPFDFLAFDGLRPVPRINTVDEFNVSDAAARTPRGRTAIRDFLETNRLHPKYASYAEAIAPFGYQEDVYKSTAQRTTAMRRQLNLAFKRKSKFGIEYQVRQARGHLHFVLADLDMNAVVRKTHGLDRLLPARDALPAAKWRSITGSELRWIYRHRTDSRVRRYVQFWDLSTKGDRLVPVQPPWDDDTRRTTDDTGTRVSWKEAWKRYKPTRDLQVLPETPMPRALLPALPCDLPRSRRCAIS